jgi:hypothetical protein
VRRMERVAKLTRNVVFNLSVLMQLTRNKRGRKRWRETNRERIYVFIYSDYETTKRTRLL